LKGACPFTFSIHTTIKIYKVRKDDCFDVAGKALRYKKNIRLPFPDLWFIEGQTNCFKKRSEKLYPFSKTGENILITIFSGGNTDSG
jgi:hypothetical protein